jgi:hypothetical protein
MVPANSPYHGLDGQERRTVNAVIYQYVDLLKLPAGEVPEVDFPDDATESEDLAAVREENNRILAVMAPPPGVGPFSSGEPPAGGVYYELNGGHRKWVTRFSVMENGSTMTRTVSSTGGNVTVTFQTGITFND